MSESQPFFIPSDAIIAREKLTRYLLVPKPTNDKCHYLAQAGFDQSNAPALEAAIRQGTTQNAAVIERVNEHGTYYNVRCSLTGPRGVALPVVLVWLRRLDAVFSFVTLIPDKEKSK